MKRKAVAVMTAMATLSSVLFLTSCDAALDKISDAIVSGFDDGKKAMASSYDTGKEQFMSEVEAGKKAIGDQINNVNSELISTEELLDRVALNLSRYQDVDWDQLIMDYYLTEESVEKIDLVGLVKDYLGEIDSTSAGFIFSDNGLPKRKEQFGAGVNKVCYYRMTPEKTDSVIIDLKEHKRITVTADRPMTVDLLFKDGTRSESEYSEDDGIELVYTLLRNQVFNLQNVEKENEDKHFELVLEYDDGTVFRLLLAGSDAPVSFEDIFKAMNK